MVRKRESKQTRNANQVRSLEEDFLNQVDKFTLTDLTLEQLADRYKDIDRQSQMMKGLILLEARNRFSSNQEFGNWVVNIGLSDDSFQNRNLFMNLARFFQNRKMSGISLTVAYEISRPSNEGIAEKIYEYALNKNLKVSDIKEKIKLEKNKVTTSETESNNPELKHINKIELEVLPEKNLISFIEEILSNVSELTEDEAIKVFNECINKLLDQKQQKNTMV